MTREIVGKLASWSLPGAAVNLPNAAATNFPLPQLEYSIPLKQFTMSNLQSILDAADKYAEQTGINLKDNPFTDEVNDCDSPTAVLLLLQENLKAFKDYREKDRKFIECVGPVVQVVHAFSGILGEAASLVSRNQSFRC